MSLPSPAPVLPARRASAVLLLLVVALVGLTVLPAARVHGESGGGHLVVSEIVTGGASASDEFVELYNPSGAALPLEGLELVYVSASGLTVSRRAAWELGAPAVAPGRHVLVANEAGIYASIADATYASGIAATGGSVALRIIGASSAIDAVGWGTAASTWLEGSPAVAPVAGSSIERLPGGSAGSTQDSDDNARDFVVRAVPEPQNLGSDPVPGPSASGSPAATPVGDPTASPGPSDPGATLPPSATLTAVPTPSASPIATDDPTPVPSSDPGPATVSVATARGLSDGSVASVEVTAVTGSGFTDGGGYVADASGGIAVLSAAAFDRGERLRLTGTLDDRYAQRTLRVVADGLVRLGTGAEPAPLDTATGGVGEGTEGRLVRLRGAIAGSPSTLTSGIAYDVDDGSGSVRVLVGTATGIDLAEWESGRTVTVVGVAGQRDSTGTGTSGYRVQPRDPGDVTLGAPEPSPTPTPSASAPPGGGTGTISIAAARQAAKNAAVRIRGVVTMPVRIVDPVTVVVQDATAAIVLRIGEEVGTLARGALVEVSGVRSTMAGMETVRVTAAPHAVAASTEPGPVAVTTGAAGESLEARLVTVRGALVTAARRYASGTVSFEIDDGSGPLRVSFPSVTGIDATPLAAGTWIEVRGVLGQETTGSQPLRGYRVWPRDAADLRVVAPARGEGDTAASDADGRPSDGASTPSGSLADVGADGSGGRLVGATLVVGPWAELAVGGVLWDGARLVALDPSASDPVEALLRDRALPVAVQLDGLRLGDAHRTLGIPVAALPDRPGALLAVSVPPAAPRAAVPRPPDRPSWTSLVGTVRGDREPRVTVEGGTVALDRRCEEESGWQRGQVGVVGIGLASPSRLIVPCGGVIPVPTLGGRAAPLPHVGAASTAETAALGAAGDPPAPRWPAAGLVAVGALMLGGAAAYVRRFGAADDPVDETDPATGAGDPAPSSVAPPALTLVTMPHERAP